MVPYDSLSAPACQHLTIKRRTWPYQLSKLRTYRNDDMERVSISLTRSSVLITYRLGAVINIFRTTKLGLEPLTGRSGPGVVDRLRVPWTYCFSPELVPKPRDWQNHIGKS